MRSNLTEYTLLPESHPSQPSRYGPTPMSGQPPLPVAIKAAGLAQLQQTQGMQPRDPGTLGALEREQAPCVPVDSAAATG